MVILVICETLSFMAAGCKKDFEASYVESRILSDKSEHSLCEDKS